MTLQYRYLTSESEWQTYTTGQYGSPTAICDLLRPWKDGILLTLGVEVPVQFRLLPICPECRRPL